MGDIHDRQESIDRFYWSCGPCCAGCDWWRHLNPVIGECLASPPVSATERFAMVEADVCSLIPEAGHILTPREHRCGAFVDAFDWSSLPLGYRKRIGAPLIAPSAISEGGDAAPR